MTIELSHEGLYDSESLCPPVYRGPLKFWAALTVLTSAYFYHLPLPTALRQNGKFWTGAYTTRVVGLIVTFHSSTLGTDWLLPKKGDEYFLVCTCENVCSHELCVWVFEMSLGTLVPLSHGLVSYSPAQHLEDQWRYLTHIFGHMVKANIFFLNIKVYQHLGQGAYIHTDPYLASLFFRDRFRGPPRKPLTCP